MSTTLNLSQLRNWATVGAGQHSLQIKAKAIGYNESPFSSSASFQIVEPPYITIESVYPFVLTIMSFQSSTYLPWDGTLETSLDTMTWNVAAAKDKITAAQNSQTGNYVVYVRGLNNTYLWTSDTIPTGLASLLFSFFSISKLDDDTTTPSNFPVSCTGNIENLLDYQLVQQGVHPSVAKWGFALAFNRYSNTSSKFVELPRCPSPTLAPACYHNFASNAALAGLPSILVPSVVPERAFKNIFMSTSFSDTRLNWDLTHVTSIGDYAFAGYANYNLNFTVEIYVGTNLTSLSPTAFNGDAGSRMCIHYLFTDNDTPQFDVNNVIGANTGKTAAAFKIYTDNTAIKDAALAKADNKNTVTVYHLDGEEWT